MAGGNESASMTRIWRRDYRLLTRNINWIPSCLGHAAVAFREFSANERVLRRQPIMGSSRDERLDPHSICLPKLSVRVFSRMPPFRVNVPTAVAVSRTVLLITVLAAVAAMELPLDPSFA